VVRCELLTGHKRFDADSLDASLEHWARYGFCFCIFRDPADGRFIGRCGFRHDVVAFTLPTSKASRRVLEKAGMRYERDIAHITAGEWHRGPVHERFPLIWEEA
jgi:RimJ/RimL family protein N-acetyltransferase